MDQPTLLEMTTKAVQILKKNENGFVLVVEGGRIDTAHHDTLARLALDEAVELHKTVEFVRSNTDDNDTLVIVTSDHSNEMTVGGYMVNTEHFKHMHQLCESHNFCFAFPASRFQHSWSW